MTIVSGTYCLPMGGKGTSGNLKIEVVSALPATGRVDRVYFVPIEGATGNNQYTEYIWDKDRQRFEEVGPREIDLTPYATKEALNAVDNRLVAAEAEIVAVQGDVAALDADVATKQDALSAGSAIEIEDNTVGVAVFDKSKFTVVGSPVISEDGVASGFSDSDYVTSKYNLEDGKIYAFVAEGIGGTPMTDRGSYIFAAFYRSSGGDYNLRLITGAKTGAVRFALGDKKNDISTKFAILNGVKYKIELKTDFKTFVTFTDLLTGYTLTETGYSIADQDYGNMVINYGAKLGVAPLTSGSIDLSQFSITVDGEQVLSGAKTLYQALDAKQDVLTAGNNITIEDGVISATGEITATIPPATTSSLGVVQPDGTTITADDAGVISAVNAVQSETIRNIAVMTQAEYDALETKDESTFYLIREETA